MTYHAFAAPTGYMIDNTLSVGVACPAATPTAINGTGGFTVPWVPGLVLQIENGVTGCGNVILVAPNAADTPSNSVPSLTLTVGASVNLLFGPIPKMYAASPISPAQPWGLVTVTVQTDATVHVAVMALRTTLGYFDVGYHNPFEIDAQNTDF